MNQPELTISLLGGLRIAREGTAVAGFASRKAEALLAYLACNPRPHPRETLAALFWPDNDQSRALANLSVVLTSLRKQLEAYVVADRHTVAFNPAAAHRLDVAQFEAALEQAQARRQESKISRTVAAQLQTAVDRYQGDFLAGFSIRGAPEFEAWALLQQERLRQLMLEALADLVTFHRQRGQFSDGIRCAQRLLALDPLQEETHRQLMRLYALDNQRPAALAQYEQCAAILAGELGVEPDEETIALYEAVKDDKVPRRQGDETTKRALLQKHNLPAAANAFIGRETEAAQIAEWLAQPNGRLLTIVGPGGIGKTRLAQESARARRGEFADGVWYVSLVAFAALDGLVTAVAAAMGLNLSGKEDLPTQLINQLQPLEALMVLDNLEHLLNDDVRSFLSRLMQTAPELRLIATSRERLRLQAERLVELDGLPFPVIGDQYTASSKQYAVGSDHSPLSNLQSPISDYAAVQLFTNRVQQVRVDFDLAREETAVAHLCRLVGGLPLALELAAAWTRVLTVGDIVAEIEHGLDALTSPLHDVPARHRSLRAVIETSWQMLPAAEQALFRRLAVFRGGFTRAAAQQVASAALPQLMGLVDRSFLRLDDDRRFRRHPLLLQFAQAQLAAQPQEKAAAEAAHARTFADFVQQQAPALQGADAPAALAVLAADLENIRAAWQWALAAKEAPLLRQMAAGVGRFFADRSRYLEGAALFAAGVEQVRQWPETAVRDQLLAQLLVELGNFWHENGRFAEAEAILQEANQLAQTHQLRTTRMMALRCLAEVVSDQGNRERAEAYVNEALALCRLPADTEQKLLLLWRLGVLHTDNGDYAQAQTVYAQAMVLAEGLGNGLHIARLHNSIAIVANRQKVYETAVRHWRLARDGFRAWGHAWGEAATTHNLAMAYWGLEQYDKAMQTVTAAISAHEKIGHRRGMAGGFAVKATILLAQGKRRAARRNYNRAIRLSQEIGATWLAVVALVDVAELEMSYGRLQWAATLLFFVAAHPAALAATLENAHRLLQELRAELPPETMAEAETAAAALTLDDLIAQLLAES